MRHHTKDPAFRVSDIAKREEDRVFTERLFRSACGLGGDALSDWPQREIDIYNQLLREFNTPTEV